MLYSRIISVPNLTLAWRRISTATNHQYKSIFRELYSAYELAAHDNIRRLNSRLKGNWKPTSPERIYLPKPSGLQRPISLLHIEDQIVEQALANVIALKLATRRQRVEGQSVFSNVLAPSLDSIFFLKNWQVTYRLFHGTCRKHFRSGHNWIASFDLAAFYDTISHDLLVRVGAPRSFHGEGARRARQWLECWSQDSNTTPYRHGIPQGPIASDFLAEAFLLPLDEALSRDGIKYTRYVDDIRLFAKSKIEVQRAAIRLEVLCRQLGLIPQGKKFLIVKALSQDDVLGQLPSLPPRDDADEDERQSLTASSAEELIRESIGGRPQRVTDKSKLRYVLFRAPKSRRILGIVLRLLGRYPEHIDAFIAYLRLYQGGRTIDKALREALEVMPNEYVRGELWCNASKVATKSFARRVIPLARRDLAEPARQFWQRFGAVAFLLRAESLGVGIATGRVPHMPALAQSFLVSYLQDVHFSKHAAIARLLSSSAFEVSMPLGPRLAARRLTHRSYGVTAKELVAETQAVFRRLGLLGRRVGTSLDEIGDAIAQRFAVAPSQEWKRVLGGEYLHCLQLLVQAESAYDASRSLWLQNLNSFNDAVARTVIAQLSSAGLPGGAKTVDRHGQLVTFGSLVQVAGPFDRAYPNVAGSLRSANDRRNRLPLAHPYDQKTGTRNRHLTKPEQRALHISLSTAYGAMIPILVALPD